MTCFAFLWALKGEARTAFLKSITYWIARSIFGDSPGIYRRFWMEIHRDGSRRRYSADFDQAALNLMAQRGIACPILVQGRDFEILGAAGRYLPFLAVFIVSIGTVFLLRMRRSVMQFSRTHA
jgi:hypothetical protein